MIKECPTCKRTYADQSIAFCLADGSLLSAPYDPQSVWRHPDSKDTEPPPTEILYPLIKAKNTIPSVFTRPSFAPSVEQTEHADKGGGKSKLIIGAVVLLVLLGGVIVAASLRMWLGSNNSLTKQSSPQSTNGNTIPQPTSSPTPSPTPQSTPPPTTTPPLMKVDITGTWSGMFAGREAFLFINSQEGNSFTGILKNSKGAIVAISGHINLDTRQISIQENRVIEGVKEGSDWVLGSDTGTLSADGKSMSGKGIDRARHLYAWSFAK